MYRNGSVVANISDAAIVAVNFPKNVGNVEYLMNIYFISIKLAVPGN